MAVAKVKFDLGLSRFMASVFIFMSHNITHAITRGGHDWTKSTVSQYIQVYLGLPSLVLLCLITGIVANLTPVPERSNPQKLGGYLTENVGLWFRLSVVFNGFAFPLIVTLMSRLTSPEMNSLKVYPLQIPLQILLGSGAFWYLPALLYWSILRLWIRTPRQMKQFSAALLVAIMALWLLPDDGGVLSAVVGPVNRVLIGIWFMAFGYLQGPSFFGKVMRQPIGRLLGFLAIVAIGIIAHEFLLNHLFPEQRTIAYYLQPAAIDLNPTANGMWDVAIQIRLLALLQNLLMWAVICGCALIHLYITARLGSLFPARTNVLLAETSFTVYVLHFPLLTFLFGWLFSGVPDGLNAVIAFTYASVLSILLCSVTLLIRHSVWLRFWIWYKV